MIKVILIIARVYVSCCAKYAYIDRENHILLVLLLYAMFHQY